MSGHEIGLLEKLRSVPSKRRKEMEAILDCYSENLVVQSCHQSSPTSKELLETILRCGD